MRSRTHGGGPHHPSSPGADSIDDLALLRHGGLSQVFKRAFDEVDVMVGLARFDLLTLARPTTERRFRILAEPED